MPARSKTGSLMTASSSGESVANRTSSTTAYRCQHLRRAVAYDIRRRGSVVAANRGAGSSHRGDRGLLLRSRNRAGSGPSPGPAPTHSTSRRSGPARLRPWPGAARYARQHSPRRPWRRGRSRHCRALLPQRTAAPRRALSGAGYAWSPGDFGRPKCWYRDVADADRAAEVSWLRANALGPNQAVWALRITARNRYSDRCWSWGESLDIALECAAGRHGRRWSGVMTPDIVREGQNDRSV
jgi:hypothetical protein